MLHPLSLYYALPTSFPSSAVFPNISALENVRAALQRGRGESVDCWRYETVLRRFNEEAMQYLGDVGLTAFADIKAGELPYGRKRALEIATTLALEPELLLLPPTRRRSTRSACRRW